MSFKIPLFDLNYGLEEEKAVIKTLRSKWISMGQNVMEIERRFATHLGVTHAIAVTNCTAALHLAMRILDIGPGDEVIVPSLTFVATVNAVRYVGANPIFTDITGYDNFSIDIEDIKNKITDRTKAIIVMHYGGFPCEMSTIMDIAHLNNLYVVEDAAHAPDSEYKGKKLGSFGHIGCFSFFGNKNITCGEGGILVTNDDEYANTAKILRSHGMTSVSYDRAKGHASDYDVIDLGFNYRIDDIRGAILLEQLKKLDDDVKRRKELRNTYIKELNGLDNIIIPYLSDQNKSSNYIFPVVLKDGNIDKREKIRRKLAEAGIQTSVHYPAAHRFPIYKQFSEPLLTTEYVSDNEITLPLYPKMKQRQIKHISDILKESF